MVEVRQRTFVPDTGDALLKAKVLRLRTIQLSNESVNMLQGASWPIAMCKISQCFKSNVVIIGCKAIYAMPLGAPSGGHLNHCKPLFGTLMPT